MTMLSPRIRACALMGVIVFGACNKSNPAAPSPAAPAAPTNFVFVTGAAPMSGATSQFTATAVAPDGTQTNVTAQATWRSSNQSVVSVDQGGVVRGVAVGSADLSATYNGITGTTPLIVSAIKCVFSLDPATAAIPSGGGSVTIAVNNVQGQQCSWSAQATGFLRIVGPASGTGSGSIVVAADPIPSGSRAGTVSVAGGSVTISQVRIPCVTSVSPQSQNVSHLAGTFVVNVTAPASCDWVVEVFSPFIAVVGSLSGSGSAQVSLQVAQNEGANPRTAILRIDRYDLTVTQAGGLDAARER